MLKRKVPNNFIRIDPDNTASKDWLILLEAGTLVGPSPSKLRVARATQERKVVKRHSLLGKSDYYLDIEDYDPRIHAVYFCPQLYRYEQDRKLVPLDGVEIGELIARALETGVKERRPWYLPSDALPDEPVINGTLEEFDTLVVDVPAPRIAASA